MRRELNKHKTDSNFPISISSVDIRLCYVFPQRETAILEERDSPEIVVTEFCLFGCALKTESPTFFY